MIINFKNGYSVKIDDAENKTKEELRDFAWAAVCQIKDATESIIDGEHRYTTAQGYDVVRLYKDTDDRLYAIVYRPTANDYAVAVGYDTKYGDWVQGYYMFESEDEAADNMFENYGKKLVLIKDEVKDAVSLERATETNTSFMPTKIKAALDEGREDVLKTEYQFLMRDLHADASPSHKKYAEIYRPEVLKKILDQYERAYKMLTAAKNLPEFVDLETVRFLIDAIRGNWLPENKLIAFILYKDGEATEAEVGSVEDGIEHIKERIAETKEENPVVDAFVFNKANKQKLTKSYSTEIQDACKQKVKDIPYYDPTDYPSIKSDYSIERLKKEARHMSGNDPILTDYEAVLKEIDELITKGSDALLEAGWSKDDARHAINMRYRELEKELRRNELKDYARELHAKIRALEKAWDLRI